MEILKNYGGAGSGHGGAGRITQPGHACPIFHEDYVFHFLLSFIRVHFFLPLPTSIMM